MATVGVDGALLWLVREKKEAVLWQPGLRSYPAAKHGRADFHGEGQICGFATVVLSWG
jgi:hypothetical protein